MSKQIWDTLYIAFKNKWIVYRLYNNSIYVIFYTYLKLYFIIFWFRKEMKKVLESKRSGASQDEIYNPTLWYYDLLLFTKDQE